MFTRTQFNWNECYERRCKRLLRMLNHDAPKPIIESETRMLFEACHGGSWKATRALFKHSLSRFWLHHGFFKWEWIRTRVFRRPQDEVLAIAERFTEEDKAIEEMAQRL